VFVRQLPANRQTKRERRSNSDLPTDLHKEHSRRKSFSRSYTIKSKTPKILTEEYDEENEIRITTVRIKTENGAKSNTYFYH